MKLGFFFLISFYFLFQTEDKMLLLQIHMCLSFPLKSCCLLLNEVKGVTLEQLPKLLDLFEVQVLVKITLKPLFVRSIY